MFAVTQANLLNVPTINLFLQESAKKYKRPTCQDFKHSNFLYLSTKKSEICIFCVPFNVIKMARLEKNNLAYLP